MECDFTIMKSGTWYAVSDSGCRYFCFNADRSSGSFSDTERGIGLAFRYENGDDKANFHLGAEDNISSVVITMADENNARFTWDDGTVETLTYVSEKTDNFVFYCDDELIEMALKYYEKTTGSDNSKLTAAAESNADGTVAIQLYESLEDHNSTASWYTVDRITAVGTDVTGAAVDLK